MKTESEYIPFGEEWAKEVKKLNKDIIISLLKTELIKKNDFEKDLVSFGSYLLSERRKTTIIHPEQEKYVGHHDLENWKTTKKNIEFN